MQMLKPEERWIFEKSKKLYGMTDGANEAFYDV
jgi:hypothetical protein